LNMINMWTMLYYFLCYFIVYSFLGWCLEVTYLAVSTGKFVNRGFLNGPLCPVYGFGALLVIVLLTPIKENLLVLFIGSVLLTSLLEFVTGYLLQKLFHQRLWDYSKFPFNLKGYVCLKFSLGWGIACVFVMKLIHPLTTVIIKVTPTILGYILLAAVSVYIMVDLISTVKSVLNLNMKLKQIEEISVKIRSGSDKLGQNLSDEVLELKDKYDKLIEQRNMFSERFIKAFPNVRSTIHFEALEDIKTHLLRKQKKGSKKGH